MPGAEPPALVPHVLAVPGVRTRDLLPADLVVQGQEVAVGDAGPADVACAVGGHGPVEQGAAVPRCAEEDRGRAGRGGHGAELAVEPLPVDLLRFLGNEREGGGVAGDVRLRRRAEEGRAGAPHRHRLPRQPRPRDVAHEGVGGRQRAADAGDADLGLRRHRRRAQDDRAAGAGVGAQQVRDEHGGEFVLPGLAGEEHREGLAAQPRHPPRERAKHTRLVRPQRDIHSRHGSQRRERRATGERPPWRGYPSCRISSV